GEQIAIRAQRVRDLAEKRHGDLIEKPIVGAARLVTARAAFRGAPFRAFDRVVQPLSDDRDFHNRGLKQSDSDLVALPFRAALFHPSTWLRVALRLSKGDKLTTA